MKTWPKWVETGICTDNYPVETPPRSILKEFVKNNFIGDTIEINRDNRGESQFEIDNSHKCREISTGTIFRTTDDIPDSPMIATITGLYCGKKTWRIEVELVDFEMIGLTRVPHQSQSPEKIHLSVYLEDIIVNHTRLERESGAVTKRSAETANQYAMLNRGVVDPTLFKGTGWGRETGSAGGGKRMRKTKSRKSKKRKSKRKKGKSKKRTRRR